MSKFTLRAQDASECDLKTSNFENFPGGPCPQTPLKGHGSHASVLHTLIQNIPLVPGLLPEQSLRASTSPGYYASLTML